MKMYYDIKEDLKECPNAWCYIVIGGNSTGKTFSTLLHCYENKIKFAFIKRTNDDVDFICSSKKDVDLSPFKSINNYKGSNVVVQKLGKGLGGFYEDDNFLGYIASLNAVGTIKGFDVSEVEVLIFDEFIPQPWERVDKKEGDKALVMYRTISRDREFKGKQPLKFICLANATKAFNPLTNILEVTDNIVEMKMKHETKLFERGIFIHLLDENFGVKDFEKETAIQQAMKDTDWGRMSSSNEFAYDDFTHVGKTSLKGYRCWTGFKVKNTTYYIYQKFNKYYVCKSKQNVNIFDLNIETERDRFYREVYFRIYPELINGNILFSDYTSYYLIYNMKGNMNKIF